ncbi:MAG: dihydropteroate synthase, partial [Kordiimonadaceae bacterium]|nr:dihydropteroate synthase [Kordiimonadaceae bacterium]MBT6329914.1 dihydropteroate synthase [Kordiimonadaceae bacterium]
MESSKIYVQPLGFLRGLTVSSDNFKRLVGGNIYFSALKIITRRENDVSQKIISVENIDDYLQSLPDDKCGEIKNILDKIERVRPPLNLKNDHIINWENPIIQGVLNVTPDSFSDGGVFDDFDKSIAQAKHMIASGADIIDIGGETTKPGAKPVSLDAEKKRVSPVIEKLAQLNIPISIDSRNAEVMQDAVKAGAHIINDVSALEHDSESINALKEAEEVPVILMHAQGSPETMQDKPEYENVVLDIYDYLKSRIEFCLNAGIAKDKIIIDPGIGF